MKVRDLIKMVEKDGWEYMYTSGSSHRQFKHPDEAREGDNSGASWR